EECSDVEETIPPAEWREMAFRKLKKWSHQVKEFDLIDGRLVRIADSSRVFDAMMEKKLHAFKSVSRVFIGLPSMKETIRSSLRSSSADPKCIELEYFGKHHQREALTVNSLAKVAQIFGMSAQQRSVVRKTICRQVTQNKIWNGALVEILNGLKSEIVIASIHSSKKFNLAQQIIISYLTFLKSSISYDAESSSWMRLTPTRAEDSTASPKWEDALEMCIDLLNCLSDEIDLSFHCSKLAAMKEGLYQIRDVVVDRSIGYKENRFQEHLVQKKLTKSLGFSSPCLFTLLLYYLQGSIGDAEVDLRGGLHGFSGGKKYCLYMGKIVSVDEEKVVMNGLKLLDRCLGLLKFVWDTAEMEGDLMLQGHLWCIGGGGRCIEYRGNMYFLHSVTI
ncbi:hypothetical protein M569_04480, partial [Genlisea aurea]